MESKHEFKSFMEKKELILRLKELENVINNSKDIQKVVLDNPLLLAKKFEEENKERIEEFLSAKNEIRQILLKLRTPEEIEKDREIDRELREKYSDD